jgi:hypothetical protein
MKLVVKNMSIALYDGICYSKLRNLVDERTGDVG